MRNGKPAVTSSPGSRRTAAPTDGELLDAALVVFAERGYRQATMELIAERAKSTKPTLYAHFGGKETLYDTVFAREVDRLRGWVLAVYDSAGDEALEQLVRRYVMALFDYAVAHPQSFRMLFGSDPGAERASRHQPVVDAISERVEEQVRNFLTALGRTPGPSAGLLAAILVALTGGAARHVQHSGKIDPAAAGELATALIMAAINGLDPSMLDAIDGAAGSAGG
ncbi:MAG TPA: TetR/AcrR family transcriptional regulator [Rugosimonospora sp.]|nr:TetR/AcrR family transcriptional regulator [Rugosimonospora sp.]